MVPTAALLVVAMAGQAWAQPTEVTKLLAPDGATGDAFGQAIAVSGDTAIVGAYFHDQSGQANAGSAYIFQQDFDVPGEWGHVRTLRDIAPFKNDQFGRSVSISGDIAIVGSPKDDDGGHDLGSAFIFYRDQGGTDQWGQVANITAPDANPNDQFGYSVGISGDIAIVGAPFVGDNVGAAYIFSRNQGGDDQWGWVATLAAPVTNSDENFGWSVSIGGDLAIVGVPGDDHACPGQPDCDSGSAHIFSRNEGGPDQWGWTVKLTAPDAWLTDLFGASVAISGANALVGAPSASVSQGAAYIFNEDEPGPTNGWGEVAILTASDGDGDDYFGIGVSIRGEGAIVGAFGHWGSRGAAYIYRFDDSSWVEQDRLQASDGLANDMFGRAVSISGDFATIGAPGDDDLGNAAGSGFVFDGVCPCPWDLSGNGSVGSEDLLELLFAWGTNPGGPPDFDGDGDVDIWDLITLLANWGNCPCVDADPPKSLRQEIEDAGLLWPADWDKLVDIMQNGTQDEKDNAVCWFEYYIRGCDAGPREACSDTDPFNNCRTDLNDDCVVDSDDLTILLGAWAAGTADGDINGDCVTDATDMTLLLGAWGPCPEPCGGEGAQGGGGSGPAALESALVVMGFGNVAQCQAWLSTASDAEAFTCGCVLEVLLSTQP